MLCQFQNLLEVETMAKGWSCGAPDSVETQEQTEFKTRGKCFGFGVEIGVELKSIQ